MPTDSQHVRGVTHAAALRPALYAGLVAVVVSVTAALLIRRWPASESTAATGHFVLTGGCYVTAGVLATRLGAAGWRAGMVAGLVDTLIGHTLAFFLARPPEPSQLWLPRGVEPSPQVLWAAQLGGALLGAAMALLISAAAGALGGYLARRTRLNLVAALLEERP